MNKTRLVDISMLFSIIILKTLYVIFSASEPKAQVHYCDHALSVVRRR